MSRNLGAANKRIFDTNVMENNLKLCKIKEENRGLETARRQYPSASEKTGPRVRTGHGQRWLFLYRFPWGPLCALLEGGYSTV